MSHKPPNCHVLVPSGGGGGLATGPAGAGAENDIARWDTSGIKGSDVALVDGTFTRKTVNGGFTLTPNGTGNTTLTTGRLIFGTSGVSFQQSGSNILDIRDAAGTTQLVRFIIAGGGNESVDIAAAAPLLFNGDSGLMRVAAGVTKSVADVSGTGGWNQWAGESYLAADATNATATMAATGLSVTVKTGRKYGFKLLLFLSDSVAADGAQIDFAGGTATETNFRAQVTAFDAALALSAQLDDLTDVASIATFTGNGSIEVHGSFEPSSNGTFAVRFAQAAHTAGTLTLYRGSHLLVWDMP